MKALADILGGRYACELCARAVKSAQVLYGKKVQNQVRVWVFGYEKYSSRKWNDKRVSSFIREYPLACHEKGYFSPLRLRGGRFPLPSLTKPRVDSIKIIFIYIFLSYDK